ncbi:DUF1614 domain-containing protein [Candidatus Aerophobetes bacterium]|nr:DUF1614 domain-containing protein [Candidatus Aerophobetes bacterium]
MFLFPLSVFIFILFLLLLPFLFILLQIGIVGAAFQKLGLSPKIVLFLLLFSLLGSMVNIPIARRSIYGEWSFPFSPGLAHEQIIAINLGGAIIPILLCIYLFPKAPFLPTLISTLIMIGIAKLLAKPVPGVGITLPALIPPFIVAILALTLARKNPVPVAYISGVLGTLIGADLLNLHKLETIGIHMLSIGGAGIYDGIYLVGILSALLTF